jgi:hypothetical protein
MSNGPSVDQRLDVMDRHDVVRSGEDSHLSATWALVMRYLAHERDPAD